MVQESLSLEPKFVVFHHVGFNLKPDGSVSSSAPMMYLTHEQPELKGGFAHFTDNKGIENYISGNITIRRHIVRL